MSLQTANPQGASSPGTSPKQSAAPRGARVESVDLLRGLIMIIMAIDHTRDFFSSASVDPSDPIHSWPALFATRWITHLCAPGFVALAGVSIYLQRARGKSVHDLRIFLVTRGLWLAVFDLLGFSWLISFCVPPPLTAGPLWVSGLSMIVLSLLLPLSARVVGLIGVAILVLHNLLDPIQASRFGHAAILWELLHQQTIAKSHGVMLAIIYPLIPWIGIIAVGYALARCSRSHRNVVSASALSWVCSRSPSSACFALFAAMAILTGTYPSPTPPTASCPSSISPSTRPRSNTPLQPADVSCSSSPRLTFWRRGTPCLAFEDGSTSTAASLSSSSHSTFSYSTSPSFSSRPRNTWTGISGSSPSLSSCTTSLAGVSPFPASTAPGRASSSSPTGPAVGSPSSKHAAATGGSATCNGNLLQRTVPCTARRATITGVLELSTPLRFVKRIGERVAAELARRDLHTVEDLLYHLPFRYEDRLHPQPIAALKPGTVASVIGEVRGATLLRTSRMPLFEMTVGQGTSSIKAMWFNGAYLKDRFPLGSMVALYGQLEASRSTAGRLKMIQPQFELLPTPGSSSARGSDDDKYVMLEVDRIVPVYETLGGTTAWGARLTSRWLRRVLWHIFEDLAAAHAASDSAARGTCHREQSEGPACPPPPLNQAVISTEAKRSGEIPSVAKLPALDPHETLPKALLHRLQLPPRLTALRQVHFPEPGTNMLDLIASTTPAHRRLVFEEFFFLELGLELKRRRLRERKGTTFVTNDSVRRALKQVLPFHPTTAQKRVLGEIVADMRCPQPMRRLLQGDVGSGKTIVAIQAALIAIENGYQVALMAPTEILATQHYPRRPQAPRRRHQPPHRQALPRLSPHRLARYRHQTRSPRPHRPRHRPTRHRHPRPHRRQGRLRHNLGLVIIDEQHRFGVQQRFRLMRKPDTAKGEKPGEPDTLVMTATPIPRTLALTLYGDLDASVIDELPPGRTPITTRRTSHQRMNDVWTFLRKQIAAGRQAYIVYPIIEGANEDQAELDFAHDEEPASSTADQPHLDRAPLQPNRRHLDRSLRHREDAAERSLPSKSHHHQTASDPSLSARHAAPDPIAARLIAEAKGRKPATAGKQPKKVTNKKAAKPASHFPKQKLRAAADMYDELRTGALAGLRLGLLHGRLTPAEKEITMRQFARGDLDVLVATTVIEVGVDVPNATLMVIDHAERFGLSQLHQLRGRVGRGANKSFCLLVTGDRVSEAAEARLNALVSTTDGFALAEFDLQQRGPGEFFGTRQAGTPELRVANLLRDRPLLELARTEAQTFAAAPDPATPRAEIDAVWTRLREQWQRRYGLVEA